VYPAIARSRQIQGAVILRGLVGADGTVTQIKVIDSAHGVLNDAAVKAFSQFRYEPGTRNGVATPSLVQVTVKFEFK
jgi:protein TonB